MIRIKESDLLLCCGSTGWARQMAAHSFPNSKEVFATGDSIWWSLKQEDWLEALHAHKTHHPWSRDEQASSRHASEATLADLRDRTLTYETHFGFPFVVNAHGRSAHSILEVLKDRLAHSPETELRIAAEQQLEITHTRLKRILPS